MNPRSNGYTLLEVLVSLVILGMALAFLTGTVSDSLTRAERSRAQDHATLLAESILARAGRDVPLANATGQDDGLLWRLRISSMTSRLVIPLDQVDLTVTSATNKPIGHWRTLRKAP